jgi:hypothetical protein
MSSTIPQTSASTGQEVGRTGTIDEDVPMDEPMDVDESPDNEVGEGQPMDVDDNINDGNPMVVD